MASVCFSELEKSQPHDSCWIWIRQFLLEKSENKGSEQGNLQLIISKSLKERLEKDERTIRRAAESQFWITCWRRFSRVYRLHTKITFSRQALQNQRHMRESCSCHRLFRFSPTSDENRLLCSFTVVILLRSEFRFRVGLFIYQIVMQVMLCINSPDRYLN